MLVTETRIYGEDVELWKRLCLQGVIGLCVQ